MNNKKLGTEFEKEFCDILSKNGWWVHFIQPNMAGAQPFDVIAVKHDIPIAIDCKTCEDKIFPLSRLEENQKFAFDKWKKVKNSYAYIAVKRKTMIYMIDYDELKELGKIRLTEAVTLEEWMEW